MVSSLELPRIRHSTYIADNNGNIPSIDGVNLVIQLSHFYTDLIPFPLRLISGGRYPHTIRRSMTTWHRDVSTARRWLKSTVQRRSAFGTRESKTPLAELIQAADRLQRQGHERILRVARVPVPLTHLARNTSPPLFHLRKQPRVADQPPVSRQKLLPNRSRRRGSGCTEALFTLGADGLRLAPARRHFDALGRGRRSTISRAVHAHVARERLLAHANSRSHEPFQESLGSGGGLRPVGA